VPTDLRVQREDWPLLLIARDATHADGPDTLDPVRIQKGMFLLSMRGPQRDLYAFRPYNWGPYSPELVSDLNSLVALGLLHTEQEPGRTWARYRPTERGAARAGAVAEAVGGTTTRWMASVRRFLTTRSFTQLLSDIYDEYPTYATQSLFKR